MRILAGMLLASIQGCAKPEENFNCTSKSLPIVNDVQDVAGFEVTQEQQDFIYETLDLILTHAELGDFFCNIKEIQIVDEFEKEWIAGTYSDGVIRIEWTQLERMSLSDRILIAHEVGHHIHYRLPEEEFQEFSEIGWGEDGAPLLETSGYLESYPGSMESDDPYGMTNSHEDFAVVFSYHIFAHDHLHTFTDEAIVQKAAFMDEHFPRYDENAKTLSFYEKKTHDESLIAKYVPDKLVLDDNSAVWFGSDRSGGREEGFGWYASDGKGYIAQIAQRPTLTPEGASSSGITQIADSIITQVYDVSWSELPSVKTGISSSASGSRVILRHSQIVIRQTDEVTGATNEMQWEVPYADIILPLAYDPQENSVLYAGDDALYRLSVESGELQTIAETSGVYTVKAMAWERGLILFVEGSSVNLYDTETRTVSKAIFPEYGNYDNILPYSGGILLLGTASPNAPEDSFQQGYFYNPDDGSFTPIRTNLKKQDFNDVNDARFDEDTKTAIIIDGDDSFHAYKIFDDGTEYVDAPLMEVEEAGLLSVAGPWSGAPTQYSSKRPISDPISGTVYLVSKSWVEVYDDSGSLSVVNLSVPDSIDYLSSLDLAFVAGRLMGSQLEEDGLLHFYEMDLESQTVTEITTPNLGEGAVALGTYDDRFIMTAGTQAYDYGIETRDEVLVQAFDPISGENFSLPPLPIDGNLPKSVLCDGDLIYVITTDWMLTYDKASETYVAVTPVDYPGSTPYFFLKEGRPTVIGYENDGSGNYETFVCDLLSGQHVGVDTGGSSSFYFTEISSGQIRGFSNVSTDVIQIEVE